MKKILFLVLALLLTVSLYAQTISKTSIEVCDSSFSCYGSTYPAYDSHDLGNIGRLELNGSLTVSSDWGAASANMYCRLNGGEWFSTLLDDKKGASEVIPARSPVSGDGGDAVLLPQLGKTLADYTVYSRTTDRVISTSDLTNGVSYALDVYHSVSGTTMPADAPTSYYSATFTKVSDITFSDGSSFTPSITAGNSNEVIGRFFLTADVTGAALTDVSLDLSGTRSGFSNFKLWSSTDSNFDDASDTQLGSTIAVDPGAGPAAFLSVSSSVGTGGVFYFLTADVAEDASGSIRGSIGEAADLTISDGEISNTIATAYLSLSSAEVPTPITLASFTAEAVNGTVRLEWITESETENSHFLVYRDDEIIARVEGNGTTSETHSYSYLDTRVKAGNHAYVLSDVSFSGVEVKQAPVNVEIESEDIAADFVLNKAYPNPFNPKTVITMHYTVGSQAVVNIYNFQGELVETLADGFMSAGTHQLTWDASAMPSGVYLVSLQAGSEVQTMKVILMK